jgi:hypothetical protein
MPEDPKNPYEMRQDCLFGPGLDEENGVDVTHFRWPSDFEGLAHDIYRSRDVDVESGERAKAELVEMKKKMGEMEGELTRLHAENKIFEMAVQNIPEDIVWLPMGGDPNCDHEFAVHAPCMCVKCGARERPMTREAMICWPRMEASTRARIGSLEFAGGKAMSAALAAKEELILGGNWAVAANVIAQAKKLWDERIK